MMDGLELLKVAVMKTRITWLVGDGLRIRAPGRVQGCVCAFVSGPDCSTHEWFECRPWLA